MLPARSMGGSELYGQESEEKKDVCILLKYLPQGTYELLREKEELHHGGTWQTPPSSRAQG